MSKLSSQREYRKKNRRAFTLVEISIAFFIIVVALVPVIEMILASRKLDTQARIESAAYSAAREELETLRAQSFGDRVPVSGASFTIPSTITAEFPNQNLQGLYSVTTLKATTPQLQQISVQVSWTRSDHSGDTSYIRLDSAIAQGAGK